MIGKRFSRLTVIAHAPRRGRSIMWLVRCDCGAERVVYKSNVTRGMTTSCGCYHRELMTKHGHTKSRKTPEYSSWNNIKGRILCENHRDYPSYGGRGLKIHEPWKIFENFLADMGPSPGRGYSVERLDVNRGYFPDNCVWATQEVQTRNQRRRKNNTSGVNGVYFDKKRNKWAASISLKWKTIHIGRFDTIEQAAAARKAANAAYGYNSNHGCETQ